MLDEAANQNNMGDQTIKEVTLGYKYLELVIDSYNKASGHPELTCVEREKVRKVLEKSAYQNFGSPDQTEINRLTRYSELYADLTTELTKEQDELEEKQHTKNIQVKEKKNQNVSCFDYFLKILGNYNSKKSKV